MCCARDVRGNGHWMVTWPTVHPARKQRPHRGVQPAFADFDGVSGLRFEPRGRPFPLQSPETLERGSDGRSCQRICQRDCTELL